MDPGFLAREAGIRVGNDAVALPGEAVRAAESIWKAVSSPLDTIGAIAGGIGGLALGFKDWITSPIPSHTLEKQFDKVATASAQELGGMAFDAATGLITAYIGGRAVEWAGEKWVSAKGTAGTQVTKGPCCFAAGTKVSTPQDDRVIESLKVGDVVWSKPEKGGKPFAAAILATHQRSDQPIYRLKLKSVRGAGAAEGETLLVTPSHPFYVPAKHDFIPVKDLEPGDLLQSLADGDTENTSSEVESLELYLPEGKTYNLTVDVGHTFYVGELKTLVHNTGPCDLPPDYFAGGAKVSADFPEGLSFNPNIKSHLSSFDGFTQKNGISGTHNLDAFNQAAATNGLKILSETPTSVAGVTTVRYQIPAYDRAGNIVGFKDKVFPKTVYDPKIFADQKILDLGQQAAASGYKEALSKGLSQYDSVAGHVTLRVYLDKSTGTVTNFHPK